MKKTTYAAIALLALSFVFVFGMIAYVSAHIVPFAIEQEEEDTTVFTTGDDIIIINVEDQEPEEETYQTTDQDADNQAD